MLSDESEVATPTRLVFSLPPVTASAADSQLVSSSAKPLTTTQLPSSCGKVEFAKAMLALTTLKRTSDFTKQQLQAWHCVLRRFPARVINLSVVELATSETRFPELADLFRLCQRKMPPREYCPMRGDDDLGKPGKDAVAEIARELGLDV
jgi:hypothetical protein